MAQFTVSPPQHFLYFFPEPHGHGSFRPTLLMACRRSGRIEVPSCALTHPAATELRENAIVRDGLAYHLACVAMRRRTAQGPRRV